MNDTTKSHPLEAGITLTDGSVLRVLRTDPGSVEGTNAMTETTPEILARVWQAISDELDKRGDGGMHDALGWIKDEDRMAVARAALEAANDTRS